MSVSLSFSSPLFMAGAVIVATWRPMGALRVTYVVGSGQELVSFMGQVSHPCLTLSRRHCMHPACSLMSALSASMRGGRHALTGFLVLAVVEDDPATGRSDSLKRRSFFSLWQTAWAAEEVSTTFCMRSSSAHRRSSRSLTSKPQAARLVAFTGSCLRLHLRSGLRFERSWTWSWTLVRVSVGAKEARIEFRFSISIFQSMNAWWPCFVDKMVSRMSWAQSVSRTRDDISRR